MVQVVGRFNQNIAFISLHVYVVAAIYYHRQFRVAFNLDTLALFYSHLKRSFSPHFRLECSSVLALKYGLVTLNTHNLFFYRCPSPIFFYISSTPSHAVHSLSWNWICSQLFLMVIVVTAVCYRPKESSVCPNKNETERHGEQEKNT